MADATDVIVNTWFQEKLARAPLSYDTDAYNQVREALPDLVARLAAGSAQAPAPANPVRTPPKAAATPDPAPEPQPEPAADA